MVALFAAIVSVNARQSWRPATVDFATRVGSALHPHTPVAWQGDGLWFLSSFAGGPVLDTGIKGFRSPNLVREAHNWNRAPLPLVVPQSLQNTYGGLGTLCAAHHLFACTSGDGEIQIWRDEKLERTVREKSRARTPQEVMPEQPDILTFSPDGKYLVSSSDLEDGDGTHKSKIDFCIYGLVLFDVAGGRQLARQSAFEGAFADVAWSPDSREFAGLTLDGWVFVFDSASGKLRLKFRAHQLFGAQIAWSPDGKTLVTATNPRLMMTPRNWKFDLKSGPSFSLGGSNQIGDKFTLATKANGDATWNGRTERLLKRFDARTGQQIGSAFPLQTGAVDIAFSPDGKQLALGEHEFALVLNAQTLKTERRLNALTVSPTPPAPVCVAWSQDSATLATSTVRGLTLWRMR